MYRTVGGRNTVPDLPYLLVKLAFWFRDGDERYVNTAVDRIAGKVSSINQQTGLKAYGHYISRNRK